MTSARADWLSRAHALLGVAPLSGYLVYHLWEQWPALLGREHWVERARATSSLGFSVALVLVLLPLALHALLGVARFFRSPAKSPGVQVPGPNGAPAMRRIQAGTGALALIFVVFHLAQVYAFDRGPHYTPRDAYAALWQAVGRPVDLTLYVLGVGAICFHVAHGLPRALVTWNVLQSAAAFARVRYLAGAFGLVLWLGYLQVTSHFAIGQPLLAPGTAAAGAHQAPED